jgi:hypothetical protein
MQHGIPMIHPSPVYLGLLLKIALEVGSDVAICGYALGQVK